MNYFNAETLTDYFLIFITVAFFSSLVLIAGKLLLALSQYCYERIKNHLELKSKFGLIATIQVPDSIKLQIQPGDTGSLKIEVIHTHKISIKVDDPVINNFLSLYAEKFTDLNNFYRELASLLPMVDKKKVNVFTNSKTSSQDAAQTRDRTDFTTPKKGKNKNKKLRVPEIEKIILESLASFSDMTSSKIDQSLSQHSWYQDYQVLEASDLGGKVDSETRWRIIGLKLDPTLTQNSKYDQKLLIIPRLNIANGEGIRHYFNSQPGTRGKIVECTKVCWGNTIATLTRKNDMGSIILE